MRVEGHKLIAECTAYDFKKELERKKIRDWLKSISAYANTEGGSLFFGVQNDGTVVGLDNPFNDIEDWTVDVGAILPGDPFGYGFVGKRNEKLLKRVSGNGVSYQWTYSYDKASVRLANFVRVFTSEDSNNAMLQEVVFGY